MKRRGIQLSPRHKRWFYSVAIVLFLSGAIWVLFGRLAGREGSGAGLFRSLKSRSLQVHGGAAMAFLIALGILIPTHIRRAWQARRNRVNGAFFVTVTGVLVVTGYGLYYIGDDRFRNLASWIHLALGFATPVLLLLHIWVGRRREVSDRN